MNNDVKINGVYKHFMGDYYIVVDIAIDSDTLEKCVIYRGLYGDGPLYVRKYEDFISLVDKVKYPSVSQKYRFELQNIESVKDKFNK